jgi:hypothetical protein
MNNGQLGFWTKQGLAMIIDGSVSNNTILIGTSTSNNTYRMIVTGTTYLTNLVTNNAVINGPITGVSSITASSGVFTTKPFCIPHPDTSKPPGTRLRHRCIEGEQSCTFYTYRLNCTTGLNTFSLPDYFRYLNADDAMVYVSPIKHFGRGWGETSESNLLVTVESGGLYNILVIATRADKDAIDEFTEFGVEHVHDPEVSKC